MMESYRQASNKPCWFVVCTSLRTTCQSSRRVRFFHLFCFHDFEMLNTLLWIEIWNILKYEKCTSVAVFSVTTNSNKSLFVPYLRLISPVRQFQLMGYYNMDPDKESPVGFDMPQIMSPCRFLADVMISIYEWKKTNLFTSIGLIILDMVTVIWFRLRWYWAEIDLWQYFTHLVLVFPDEAITVTCFLALHSTLSLSTDVFVFLFNFTLLMFVGPLPWC